jgi:hypothetical protein
MTTCDLHLMTILVGIPYPRSDYDILGEAMVLKTPTLP